MNPNAPQPSFELPTPLQQGEAQPAQAERPLATPETARPSSSMPAQSMPVLPQAPAIPASMPVGQPGTFATPAVADDSDLIEKEWVEKAKQIVAATREDPHEQNKQMSKVKADYLKKRYNKDIKIEGS